MTSPPPHAKPFDSMCLLPAAQFVTHADEHWCLLQMLIQWDDALLVGYSLRDVQRFMSSARTTGPVK